MKYFLFTMGICMGNCVYGFDQSRFFQATYYPERPRFAEELLDGITFRAGTGCTGKSTFNGPISHCYNGEYQVNTLVFDCSHNFYQGFFINATIPLYWFIIHNPNYTIIQREHMLANPCITGGWTMNNENFEHLDYIDFSVETGIITPGETPFFPGWAIPLRGVVALGVYDWLTAGLAVDFVGFITKQGHLYDVAWFLEADHVAHGLSFGFGYTYSTQRDAKIPWNSNFISHWEMDTFHFFISYDFACYEYPCFPCIELFYNHILSGKCIAQTPLFGIKVQGLF